MWLLLGPGHMYGIRIICHRTVNNSDPTDSSSSSSSLMPNSVIKDSEKKRHMRDLTGD